jgi:hypothetical protein
MIIDGSPARTIAMQYDGDQAHKEHFIQYELGMIRESHPEWENSFPGRKTVVDFLNGKTS